MKKVIYGMFAFAALTFTACGGEESTEETTIVEEEITANDYIISVEDSKLEWAGSWVGGQNDGNTHNGEIKFTDGEIRQEGSDYYGHFIIDMTSIDVQDIDEASGKPKLEGHLASEDFFNISQFTTTDVKVLEIVENNAKIIIVVGGVEVERTVPINVETSEDTMSLQGEFTIDFTSLEMPGMQVKADKPEEGAVSPEIAFNLQVVLKKK